MAVATCNEMCSRLQDTVYNYAKFVLVTLRNDYTFPVWSSDFSVCQDMENCLVTYYTSLA